MDYYSVIERTRVLTHATVWMDLGNSVPSERSQTQKDTYDSMYRKCPG